MKKGKRRRELTCGALLCVMGTECLLDVERDGAFLAGIVGIARIGGGNGAVSSATAATTATTATGDYADEHGDGE